MTNALEQVARGLAGAMVGDSERWRELLRPDDTDDTEPSGSKAAS